MTNWAPADLNRIGSAGPRGSSPQAISGQVEPNEMSSSR